MIRTKILATMGPAVADVDTLAQLFRAGCNVARLNFSHGTLEGHLQTLRNIREAALRQTSPVAVLGDLCGPKIRLGKIDELNDRGGIPVGPGDIIKVRRGTDVGITSDIATGAVGIVSSIYPGLIDDVQVGHRVLIEDGLLRFLCVDKSFSEISLQCTSGGVLKSSKGINLPDTLVNIPSITDYDWQCVDWAIENDLDYLALSFVRSADDIHLLQRFLSNRRSDIHIVAKIEKAEAVREIDSIILASHGVMVARGDLGVELDLAQVPLLQKTVIRKCRDASKPVIVATQMLQSMIENSSPTRAEVSDVANAILDGTDAVMLSGETSIGKHPVTAVLTMAHVLEATEHYQAEDPDRSPPGKPDAKSTLISSAVARAVGQIVSEMKIDLVVVYSQTGATARVFSKHRMPVPIIALSSDHKVLRQMSLHFGVVPYEMPPPADYDDFIRLVSHLIDDKQLARPGARIVVVSGASLGTPGTRNSIVIHTVGSDRSHAPA